MPVFIPSWRFFNEIAPSPRVEFSLLKTQNQEPHNWQEFRPRPNKVSFLENIRRLFFNPEWNETMFVTACAEQQIINPEKSREEEIMWRIKNELKQSSENFDQSHYLQFRLVFVSRQDGELRKDILFKSRVEKISGGKE